MLILIVTRGSYSQTEVGDPKLSDLRYFVEGKYQLDDLLVQGILYSPSDIRIKGSPYFLFDRNWRSSKIFIKGRVFENQNILFDLHTNKIIANIAFSHEITKDIIIDLDFIDSIYIESHFFINISPFTTENINDLYQVVYDGSFKGLLKHRVSYQGIIKNDTPKGYFEAPKSSLYILKERKLIKISGKKISLKYFNQTKNLSLNL